MRGGRRHDAPVTIGAADVIETMVAGRSLKGPKETDADRSLDLDLLFELLKDQGTLEQAGMFLRSKGLEHSSGNWKDMVDTRLRPAYDEGKLSLDELRQFLGEVEEHGRQHVFLYKLRGGQEIGSLFDEKRLGQAIRSSGIVGGLGQGSLVNMPDKPTVTEVRYDDRGDVRCLVVKLVETRQSLSNKQESESGGKLVVSYDRRPYRAVNLLRIWSDGRAEVRIFSHRDVMAYGRAAENMWAACRPITGNANFDPDRLDALRDGLWRKDRRGAVGTRFVLRNSDHKNAAGNRLRASASGVGATMFDDPVLVASVDRFHAAKDQVQCERAAVVLRASGSEGALVRDLNLIFHGEAHEYTIAAKVTRSEYEYVLDSIIANNE